MNADLEPRRCCSTGGEVGEIRRSANNEFVWF